MGEAAPVEVRVVSGAELAAEAREDSGAEGGAIHNLLNAPQIEQRRRHLH